MERLLEKYIWAPLIAAIGILIVGSFIEDAFGIRNAAFVLFVAAGGIYLFAKFYRR